MRKKITTLLIKLVINYINEEFKRYNISSLKNKFNPVRLLNIGRDEKKIMTIKYNYDLLNLTFKTILSEKSKNEDLISEIYNIYEKGNSEEKNKISNVINFLNMTFEGFIFELNNNIYYEKYFMIKVDEYLNNKQVKQNMQNMQNEESYKLKFKEMLLNFPLIIKKKIIKNVK